MKHSLPLSVFLVIVALIVTGPAQCRDRTITSPSPDRPRPPVRAFSSSTTNLGVGNSDEPVTGNDETHLDVIFSPPEEMNASYNDSCFGWSEPGPYHWGSRTEVWVPAPPSKDRKILVYLYYPSTEEGDDKPLASGGPFPVVVFAHGLLQPDFEYGSYFRHLASWGYIVIGPNADYKWGTQHATEQYASDLRFCLDYLENESTNSSSSFLFDQVQYNNSALSGHSEGGYLSLYAAAWPTVDTRIKAIAPLAGGMIGAPLQHNLTVPILMFSGTYDILVPVDLCNEGFFESRGYSPVANVIMRRAWHCGWMDHSVELPNFLCRPLFEDNYMPREEQEELTRCLMTPFLEMYLKGNASALPAYAKSDSRSGDSNGGADGGGAGDSHSIRVVPHTRLSNKNRNNDRSPDDNSAQTTTIGFSLSPTARNMVWGSPLMQNFYNQSSTSSSSSDNNITYPVYNNNATIEPILNISLSDPGMIISPKWQYLTTANGRDFDVGGNGTHASVNFTITSTLARGAPSGYTLQWLSSDANDPMKNIKVSPTSIPALQANESFEFQVTSTGAIDQGAAVIVQAISNEDMLTTQYCVIVLA